MFAVLAEMGLGFMDFRPSLQHHLLAIRSSVFPSRNVLYIGCRGAGLWTSEQSYNFGATVVKYSKLKEESCSPELCRCWGT